MRRQVVAALGAMILAAAGFAFPVRAESTDPAGPFTFEGPTGTRQYYLHVPPGPAVTGRPLVVYLHGCIQTAVQAAAATGFSELADRLGFVVVYPQQNVTPGSSAPLVDGNGTGCWNWFLPDHQERDRGEPAVIAGITEAVAAAQDIDRDRVYVAGISAGGDMAVTLAAAYPDLYAAVGVVAACPYATCSDASGTLAYRAMGPRARMVPLFAVQGTADHLNNVALGQSLVGSWLGAADWADNGMPDGSVPRTPSSTEDHGFDQEPIPGSGDPCIRSQNWPCLGGIAGFQGTYPYTVAHYDDGAGCNLVDFWVVHGLGHAQPSAASGPFTDPLGPDVTTAAYDFFAQHPKGGACVTSP